MVLDRPAGRVKPVRSPDRPTRRRTRRRLPGRVPSEKYLRLMNFRYDRIIETATLAGATLDISYDGDEWTVTLAARPTRRRVTVTGPTQEMALTELESALGLTRWTG